MTSRRPDLRRRPLRGLWLAALCALWATGAGTSEPELRLRVGEVRPIAVQAIERVAIGNPKVADVSVVSANAVLVKALEPGETNLVIWDSQGQATTRIVVQTAPPEERIAELERLLGLQGYGRVLVKREGERIFLIGEVETDFDRDNISKMVFPYKEVANLVQIKPSPADEVPLIQLYLEVVELTKDYRNNLGVDWVDSVAFTETPFPKPTSPPATLSERVSEAFRIGSYSRSTAGPLSATLSALAKDNKARILSQPRLVTLSGKPASIFVGGEKPVVTVSSTGLGSGVTSKSIEFKEFGVRLKITPVVSKDLTRVTSKVEAEVSTIDTTNAITVDGVDVPGFKVRRASTEMSARSGDTIFIAGLLSSEDTKNLSKVPGAGDIPILGALFTSRDWNQDQTELVITVTPTIVKDPETVEAMTEALQQAAGPTDPLAAYAAQVQERIASALPPTPPGQAGGTVRVRLHLFADGHLAQTLLLQSSGDFALDDQVIRAIEAQAPYPIFPQALLLPDAWMEIPIVFQGDS